MLLSAPLNPLVALKAPAGIRSASTGSYTPKAERLPLVPTQPVSPFTANQPLPPHRCRARYSRRHPCSGRSRLQPHPPDAPLRSCLTTQSHRLPIIPIQLLATLTKPPRYVPAADCSSHSRSVTLSLRSTPSFVPLFGDSLRSATQLVPALPDCSGIDAIPVRIDSDAHSFSDAACPPPHYGDLSAQDPNTHAQCGIMPNTALYS